MKSLAYRGLEINIWFRLMAIPASYELVVICILEESE
jgi:hypothetical protein